MKRGKDEEKVMGPMFPRLHVNDTEKGGPRAPPRNKMALYEQLSIPSQRFNHSMPSNTTAGHLGPPTSQRGGSERNMFLSRQMPPNHQSEKQYSQYTDFSTPLSQNEQRKKSDEDDFTVPIFVHSFQSPENAKRTHNAGVEELAPNNPSVFSNSRKFQKTKGTSMTGSNNQNPEGSMDFLADHIQLIENSMNTEKSESLKKQSDSSRYHELGDNPATVSEENITAIDESNSPTSAMDCPLYDQNVARDLSNGTESRGDGTCRSLQIGNLERADSVSETSNLDSLSGQDMITPDDVVGVIGQKHFWKARRAIASQQRVFAVQVFELHRLLKVQRLIAASPHLLIEQSAFLGKPIKALPTKKAPLDYPIKVIPNITKQNKEKPNHKDEHSAENTIEKSSLSPVQNGIPPLAHSPVPLNSPAPSMTGDSNARPWCFSPQLGHQWLVPVMSPSEGLVYKPYSGPGPGVGGQAPGPPGFGATCPTSMPPGLNPMMANFFPPSYGVPAPHPQYQMPPFPLAGPHGYFPPYGMPFMNAAPFLGSSVEQTVSQAQCFPLEKNASGISRQNSYNKQSRANRPGPDALNLNVCDEVEVQASTGSSPSERLMGARGNRNVEGRNVLPLFPTSPVVNTPGSGHWPLESESPARVIKVVPHNPISATESAARIFQSIQEERKQYDSM